MQTLADLILDYKQAGKALGHFNISDSNQLHAIAKAAHETKLPVVVGLSEGEREFFPLREVRALMHMYQKEGIAMYLNADHTYSYEKAVEAIDAGVDSRINRFNRFSIPTRMKKRLKRLMGRNSRLLKTHSCWSALLRTQSISVAFGGRTHS